MKLKKETLKILFSITLLTSIEGQSDGPVGLIGGLTSSMNAYSAYVTTSGDVISLSNLPVGTQIASVSLNNSDIGLIGGTDGTPEGWVAFVSPNGILNTLNLNLPDGQISAVSINQSGNGLLGGDDASSNAYAALVAPDGTITVISPSMQGFILSTALNDDGLGLIGGEGGTFPYAAYVSDGVVTQIDTTPLEGGHLVVALNSQGNGIIGGFSTFGAYAAFVTPDGAMPIPLSPIPGISASIGGVAINDSGVGLIGGIDENGNMYAGYSTPSGDVTPLFGSPDNGQILSVSLNNSGTGLIGGLDNGNLYAALVQQNGTVNSLILTPSSGQISSVAINNAGIGLIGGQIGSTGYAALVAPNGALTLLDMSDQSNIASVAVNNSILSGATPASIGPYSSAFYTQLSAASALGSRFIQENKLWTQGVNSEARIAQGEFAFNEETLFVENEYALETQNSLWIAPFGDYVHLKAQGVIPNYTNTIGGALLGYDHQDCNYLVGATAGYAFNYVHYSEGIGHSKLQEEMLSLYGAYYHDHFWLDAALWGGLYQFSNVRHTLSIITSKASTHGWILSPHLEMASPWALDPCKRYFIEPFFMLDWVNNWRNHFTEKGAAGFNLKMGNLYSSLLQSEVGLRFYQRFDYRWGNFCLEEKLSYVNQAPFHLNAVDTSFVASASSFPIGVASTKVQNLGSTQIIGTFFPQNLSYPFGGFAFQVTANGAYQSYFASLFIGMDF